MFNKELQVLGVFAQKPWSRFTVRELKKAYGTKSKSYIEKVIQKYYEEILDVAMVGNTKTIALNSKSLKAKVFAGSVLEQISWQKKNVPYKEIQQLLHKMPYTNYVCLVAGSYAKGTQTPKSDIDIVILIEDCADVKMVRTALKLQCDLTIPPVHLFVFKHSEFVQMLTNSQANFGKELVQKNVVITQGQTYVTLICEAMHHGFTGTHIFE